MQIAKLVLAILLGSSAAAAFGLWIHVKFLTKRAASEETDTLKIRLKRSTNALTVVSLFVLLVGIAVIALSIVENVRF